MSGHHRIEDTMVVTFGIAFSVAASIGVLWVFVQIIKWCWR